LGVGPAMLTNTPLINNMAMKKPNIA